MNWLKKVSQVVSPLMTQAPDQNLIQILNDIINVRGGDINYAQQKFEENAPVPEEVCATIHEIGEAPEMAQYRESMRILAIAGGCPWPPQPQQQPQQQQQQPGMMDPTMMPMMGEQEKPMSMPATEF